MGFVALFLVALMPVLKMLILTAIGLILAFDRINLLNSTARHTLNNIVFYVFSPALMGAYLAKTVTLDVMIEMWFMPVNILLTFMIGSILGWILIKIGRAPNNLHGLVIGCCAAAICNEPKNPFGDFSVCMADGAAYVSVSMAVGAIYIWSYVYVIMKISMDKSNQGERDGHHSVVAMHSSGGSPETQPLLFHKVGPVPIFEKIKKCMTDVVGRLRTINLRMLFAPTTIGSIIGFIIGVVPLLKMLMIGLRRSAVNAFLIIGVIVVRYLAMPLLGIAVVRAAHHFGLVGSNPLYQFVLMLQFALPPAMTIGAFHGQTYVPVKLTKAIRETGTISQLFESGEGECSVIMMWTYAVSALALTLWSTLFMWLVSA
ncbi:hypothetical protein Cgig2_006629 [Carnegiea gigantea]|uniref:Uncharacterized protein n=1 Tax=Carnegiea gigantea TaxID=171969 RepID=A0A9Q1GWW3_9CARY|nr:hypothetical protein Cgig2_006629 [Carnegiea gigantea]